MDLVLVGAGGHAKVLLDILELQDQIEHRFKVRGCVDDYKTGRVWSTYEVVGKIDSLPALMDRYGELACVIAIGDNRTRADIHARICCLPLQFINVIHPHAIVARDVVMGVGNVICAGAIINPGTEIGSHCIVNTGASVDHDSKLGDYVHVSPGVRAAGGVTFQDGAFVGTGSAVIPGRTIGSWSQVGAGSTVLIDIPPDRLAYGSPARVVRSVGKDFR